MRDLPPDLPLDRQASVVSRDQLLGEGCSEADLRRWLRRRDLVRVHPGVYVTHTGPMGWWPRAWAAVLWAAPDARLYGASALRAYGHALGDRLVGGPPGTGPSGSGASIHLAVDRHRSLAPRPGIELHRMVDLAQRSQDHLSPPRVRYEEAVIDVASEGSRLEAVAVVTAAVSSRRTTAERLLACARRRARLRQRAWLEALLGDVAAGTCSVLEHGYLTRVERPHGLPRGERQTAENSLGGVVYRDVDYGRLLVELDGRTFHAEPRQRDRDLARDLEAAVSGRRTARLSWGLVFDTACQTAASIGALLNGLGWRGRVRRCSHCPDQARAV